MDKRNNSFEFDFTPIGQAIKQAHEAKGMTREDVAEIIDYVPRTSRPSKTKDSTPALSRPIEKEPMNYEKSHKLIGSASMRPAL